MSTEKQFGVEKEVLKLGSKQEYLALRKLVHLSKNMYNVGLYSIRQHFFNTKKYLSYSKNYHECKDNENYKLMGSAAAQQTLKKVDKNFKSFFGLLKKKSKDARIPKYLEKYGVFELSYPQFKLQDDGTFNVPMSPYFKKENGSIIVRFPTNLDPSTIAEIRIIPRYNAHYFEIEYVYKIKELEEYNLNENEALSIDLGIDNFCSVVDTLGNSFIIDGKRIKSVNQWYNKENKRLQSIKDKQHINHLTKRQVCLLKKRNNILRDYLNRTTHHIIKHCLDNGIGKLVVGHNKEWKKNSNMGKKSNQRFVQIPHSQLIQKLEALCERYGITSIKQEESYTSKASFLDNDDIPSFDEEKKETHTFSGKRVKRGLYKTMKNIYVNADINAAANILRKSKHNIEFDKVCRGLLAAPMRIKLV
ncbi:RNA-guided endonuclease InsQ/TnpB family protein [Desertibacillus haloalkaliphilus]|uniref:RNA-guided endonuclease InsQ/TnpB family protein n=1 Tax=Desertibacillus haloalkaliphilus TaxID=1328930 RepID=UPI001C25F572|nr:RNA-guided endonuclease TnpB family protein [Desertibacillus haloalkaliphilus]MBU8908418.1 transposase [Desertibacillus haloalkaliphilus]